MNRKTSQLVAFLLAIAICSMAISCVSQQEDCTEERILANKTVKEQLRCIYDLLNSGDTVLVPKGLITRSLSYRAAVVSLVESDYMVPVETVSLPPGVLPSDQTFSGSGYFLTAEGGDYLYKHKYPARFWLQQNWFPLAIAIVNSLIGVGTILVGWRNGRNRADRNQRRRSARNS